MPRTLLGLCLLWGCNVAHSQATIAVATNFATTADRLRIAFAETHNSPLTLINGSTGKLYAQITQGAPFDVFLAADSTRPQRLVAANLAEPDSRFTYALGTLVLWQPRTGPQRASPRATLGQPHLRRVAMANPDLAPYGAAAAQTLVKLGLWEPLQPKLVRGQNIGQAYAMVASHNAELGFVAASQLAERWSQLPPDSYWVVPADYHAPIAQQAVLLSRSRGNTTARAFLTFLRSERAQQLMQADRYRIPHAP